MGKCKRCDGTGYVKGFSHVKGGICFSCKGKRTQKQAANSQNLLTFTWQNQNGIRKEVGDIFNHKGKEYEVLEMLEDQDDYGMVFQKMRVSEKVEEVKAITDMEHGGEEMKRMPVGHIMTIIVKGNSIYGEHYTKTYKKESDSTVKIIDQGWKS